MAAPFGASANAVNTGPDLETIQTEALGFLSVAGDAKVRLTSPWSDLPASTSTLLSIASRKGLVAAAGPDQVVIARTDAVRKALESPKEGDSDVRTLENNKIITPMPMRISQLAFTADENYLILSAEAGGGLAVYEVQSFAQGIAQPSFELATGGESLRSLVPNPTPEKAELCAVVTNGGNLHMANLKERRISNALRSQVSCISWSAKGKQLCAGLADGTIHQMTPDGEAKAEIPRPPSLVGDYHVSSLTWLENNLFLAIHTTTNLSPPSSIYNIITREPPAAFVFQKMSDPVEPFNLDKAPYHSILRLREFPPDIQDLLIVASTASTDIGLLSRSRAPLAGNRDPNPITGVFTTTELLDDNKRPILPMTDSMDGSTPVGVTLDLSSRDKVCKPIPSDEELEESPGPLPGLWVLTHEGLLCAWWVVYTESIKKRTTFPGLAATEGIAVTPSNQAVQTAPSSLFSSSGQGAPSAFGSTAAAGPAFGASSQLGQKPSPWGSAAPMASPSTGTPVFGSNSFGAPAASGSTFGKPSAIGFGKSTQLGMRESPWAKEGSAASPFGSSGFASFANSTNNQTTASPSSGGFASFAKESGFGAVAANNSSGSSVFGSGSKLHGSSVFGNAGGSSFLPPKPAGSVFGSSPFKLESSFKADQSQKESNQKPSGAPGTSMFGSTFGSALIDDGANTALTPVPKDEVMDTGEAPEQTPQAAPSSAPFSKLNRESSTTPTSSPAPARFGLSSSPAPGTMLFGQPTKLSGSGGLFGSGSQSPKPSGFPGIFGAPKENPKASVEPEAQKIKIEEAEESLPPDVSSKTNLSLGESTSTEATSSVPKEPLQTSAAGSTAEAAPLPPDFLTPKKTATTLEHNSVPSNGAVDEVKQSEDADDAPLPPDFLKSSKPQAQTASPIPDFPNEAASKSSPQEPSAVSLGPDADEASSDFEDDNASEGSGVDVAEDLSPSGGERTPTMGFTPHSSFGGRAAEGSTPAADRAGQAQRRTLFGEIGRNAPTFLPPSATSPRSPSPMRSSVPQRMWPSEAARSVSAPNVASQVLGFGKSLGASTVSKETMAKAEQSFIQQNRKIKARQEEEEAQPLVDEDDDELQKVLASEVEGKLDLDEFIAYSNVAPPGKDSIPSQVEAVYRDINSMIDTLGLNARSVTAFLKGHTEGAKEGGRSKADLEMPDDWVLCEVPELGAILDKELYEDLEDGRVQDLDDKLDACHEMTRDMQRLRAKQEDLRRVMVARLDPDQVEVARALPLSAEQAAQQNELRRQIGVFGKLLAQAEETLTLLKTRIASASGSSAKGFNSMPTVEAVMRTITKLTSMAEKQSGDVDVLETQMRKMGLGTSSREASPMVTPQSKIAAASTPTHRFRHSLSGSVSVGSAGARATPPRKKLSGFSKDELEDLKEERARRRAVLDRLRKCIETKGVQVWNMEDIE
ncbi:hypothetical protein L249_6372 [Ophiocordyceps polyrhachis-furcata BCC 54312]|uniref:Nucleoporin Nup159/Nup146 N-terminal domain-containing protein n=1 Tax=Ophiocordyceps polyrhachis-furcata BCC 54312 TaxID=1330021 RepID=A0A367LJP2_9HYPO|nr:hypothetical protein L249_6372 [Ophiocordyceps polyrhachis-furcata BCC 54312]